MDRFIRLAIMTMSAGIFVAALYAVFSASSKGGNSDPIAKFATGTLENLDTSERGDPAPVSVFTDLAGNNVTYQDFSGNVLVVNFWATWCAPCEREMPSLAALHTAKKDQNVKVLAISVDAAEDRDYAARRLRELTGGVLDFYAIRPEPAGWDIVYDTGASGGFPTTIIFDQNGVKVAKLEGEADWSRYEAVGLINAILAR
ncbi:MAG: TlpA family protein disulfide reductase [Henriciella sp.]